MVAALFTIVVIAVTVIAFWRSRMLMHAVGVIAWLIWSFLMANMTYPEGNDYLWVAVTVFGLAMVIVMIAMWLREYFGARIKPPTSREVQDDHKKKVQNITRKRDRPWYDM